MASWRIVEWFRQGRQSLRGPRRPFRSLTLRVEALEDRLAPAVSWTGAGDGVNWGDARNWNTGQLPTAADDVVIRAAPGVTIQYNLFSGSTVHSLTSQNALNITGGSLALDAPSVIHNTVSLSGAFATLTVNGDLTVQSLVETNGTLDGTGTVTVRDQWTWSDGNVGMSGTPGGNLVLAGTAHATLSGGFFSMLTNWTVDNHGTATAPASGFDFRENAVWKNLPGSTFVLEGGAALGNFFAGTAAQFDNNGVLDLEGGTSNIGIPLNGTGAVNLDAGTLTLSGGGASGGTFALGDGTVLTVNSNYTLNPHAHVTGTGTIQVLIFNSLTTKGHLHVPNLNVAGTVTADAALTLDNLTQTGGTLGGPGTIKIDGQWTWTGGNMTGPGLTVLKGNATLSGGFFSMLVNRTVDNKGTATAVVNNGAAAGFDFQGAAVWNNERHGTFILQDGASLGNFFANGAEFNNAGLLAVQGSGASSIGFDLINNGILTIASTSSLQVNGNFTQGAKGSLRLDVGGTSAGSFGHLNISGFGVQATLGANLTVNLVNGFTPNPGDQFQILTFPSRGNPPTDFDSENLPDGLSPVFGTNSLTLVAG